MSLQYLRIFAPRFSRCPLDTVTVNPNSLQGCNGYMTRMLQSNNWTTKKILHNCAGEYEDGDCIVQLFPRKYNKMYDSHDKCLKSKNWCRRWLAIDSLPNCAWLDIPAIQGFTPNKNQIQLLFHRQIRYVNSHTVRITKSNKLNKRRYCTIVTNSEDSTRNRPFFHNQLNKQFNLLVISEDPVILQKTYGTDT